MSSAIAAKKRKGLPLVELIPQSLEKLRAAEGRFFGQHLHEFTIDTAAGSRLRDQPAYRRADVIEEQRPIHDATPRNARERGGRVEHTQAVVAERLCDGTAATLETIGRLGPMSRFGDDEEVIAASPPFVQ